MSKPMTKTAREMLHNFALTYRVESKESRNQCLDQALKELEAIIQDVIGEPLVDDITWSPTLKDPYGRRHIMDTTKTSVAKTNINHGSYETIKRQYQRLREALYGKGAEL